MKNITPNQLKNTVYLNADEFEDIVNSIYPSTRVHFCNDGIWYDRENNLPDFEDDALFEALAAYFGVARVASIHIDDCDYVGVWVVIEENDESATQPEKPGVYFIKNSVNEWSSSISGYFPTLEAAKEGLKKCSDWYRSNGTGSIYFTEFGTNAAPTLVYKK
jgi:hypothetical protein